jgi:hypothetical protein
MSSASTPFGLRPVQLLGGRVYAGAVTHYNIASAYNTSIFSGDAVTMVAAGTVERDTADAAMVPIGVFVGCSYTDATRGFTQSQYWPASQVATDAVAYVVDDPDIIMEVQADGSITQAMVGSNFGMTQTSAGSTATGNSGMHLDASSTATTNTLPVRLISIVDRVGNAAGDAFTNVLVKWNVGHQHRTTAGV